MIWTRALRVETLKLNDPKWNVQYKKIKSPCLSPWIWK